MRDPDPSTEPNLEEQKKGVYRQDREAIMGGIRQLEPLSREARQTLAASLIAATPNLEWQHPIGARHEDWSYESGATAKVRGLLGAKAGADLWRLGTEITLKDLSKVAPGDLRELVATLMTHHLRLADKM